MSLAGEGECLTPQVVVGQAQALLASIMARVCLHCAAGVPLHDEHQGPYDFQHLAEDGGCRAAKFQAMARALDDLRDEHFSPFNPEHTPRLGDRCLLCYALPDPEDEDRLPDLDKLRELAKDHPMVASLVDSMDLTDRLVSAYLENPPTTFQGLAPVAPAQSEGGSKYRHLYLSQRQHALLLRTLGATVREGSGWDPVRKLILSLKSAAIVGEEEVRAAEREKHPLMSFDVEAGKPIRIEFLPRGDDVDPVTWQPRWPRPCVGCGNDVPLGEAWVIGSKRPLCFKCYEKETS